MATSGLGPASARAAARFRGSLSMRVTPTSSPAWFSRTIIDRRAGRSTATYCRSTGPLLVRDRVGDPTSSVSLDRFRAGEDPPFFLLAPGAIASLQQSAAAGAVRRVRQRERGDRSVMPPRTRRPSAGRLEDRGDAAACRLP